MINLRSAVVPILDLRQRRRLPAEEARSTCVIVAQVGAQDVGVTVDAVSEVTTIPAAVIEPVTAVVRCEEKQRLLRGVARLEERLVLLLDLARVIQTGADGAGSGLEAALAA